ncbi:hypothetical protein LTR36_009260 [Oleoguttula mirabilis]|uniref:D-aminoacyl-tRNA deacylase n=1 Tax=Oleoguttula mirabilis TaxID=1507867 RepID=A0AAV9J6R5_9PEZI|nr:hypothetical protein LTR36_009260 [Oleoguttula mirabilis]
MKTVIQRVKSASVTVDGQLISQIAKGLLVFAAVDKNDTQKEAESMAAKVLKVKLWEDEQSVKWKKNVQEIDGEVLCVSQFTLLAITKKGNKPDFHKSATAVKGKELYDIFFNQVKSLYSEERVKNGVFQATMDVGLVNDGPVGVDYCCEDEAVFTRPARVLLKAVENSMLMCGQVTIEIETNPPEMKNPTGYTPFDPEDGDTFKGHVHKTFELPASLLE